MLRVCNEHQSLRCKKRHRIDRIVEVILGHGTRFETSRVHIRRSGVGELGLEVFELARDGKFVVAVQEEDGGHGFVG